MLFIIEKCYVCHEVFEADYETGYLINGRCPECYGKEMSGEGIVSVKFINNTKRKCMLCDTLIERHEKICEQCDVDLPF